MFAGVYNEYLIKSKADRSHSPSSPSRVSHDTISNSNSNKAIKTPPQQQHEQQQQPNLDIMFHNLFMYLDSIACNLAALALKSELGSAFSPEALASILDPGVAAIVVVSAAVGIVTSLFLKVSCDFKLYFIGTV